MTRKTQTKSADAPTAVAKPGWIQRAIDDGEKSEFFRSRITTDAECFLSRIRTTLQEFNDGQVRELEQIPIISARLGKLSADDVEKIYRYIHNGTIEINGEVVDFRASVVYSPNPKHFVTGSVTISYETDEIVREHETCIIREISNLFVHAADEVDGYELGRALLVFNDDANPNFATDRDILRRCVALANELSPPANVDAAIKTKLLIVTEGKTDIKHIQKAKDRLGITDVDFATIDAAKQPDGYNELEKFLKEIVRIKRDNKVIVVSGVCG